MYVLQVILICNVVSILYVGGMDYIFQSSRTIVIPAEATDVSFSITVIDDHVLEGNESFYLYINSAVPDNIIRDMPSQVQVIIVDDDG